MKILLNFKYKHFTGGEGKRWRKTLLVLLQHKKASYVVDWF